MDTPSETLPTLPEPALLLMPKPPRPRQLKPRPSPEPQLVDRIFDYIMAEPELAVALNGIAQRSGKTLHDLKLDVCKEFDGERGHVSYRKALLSDPAMGVLALFNGRNATEVARKLNVGRATVYRHLKQPGTKKY
jgi:hypothetical protein